ncbi:MAG: hypothetical protein HY661_13645 [Betaproteobacteria bacterium]|nr:hypothetical protein [Betaproteobacteria bacterium]
MKLNLDIGACIYCGSTASPLSREHVLPRGLGGNLAPEEHSNALVLNRASCESCRAITQKIEEKCLVSMMGPGRSKLGLRRKDRAPNSAAATVRKLDGTADERNLDWNLVPGPVVLPAYYEPGEFSQNPLPEVAPWDAKIIVVAPATRALAEPNDGVGVKLTVDSQVFAQMLAKIGLGVAVAVLGVDGFKPTVQELIISDPSDYGRWVGGDAGSDRKCPKSKELHSIRLTERGGPNGAYVIVHIWLFAEFGGPRNYVVVGRNS